MAFTTSPLHSHGFRIRHRVKVSLQCEVPGLTNLHPRLLELPGMGKGDAELLWALGGWGWGT